MLKKISILDILIVLVLIGAIGFIGMKFIGSGTNKGERKNITYSVMINAQKKGQLDKIKPGDIVCIAEEQDEDKAVVKNVTREIAEVTTYNSNTGEYKLVKNEDKEDITIELETNSFVDDIGMRTGETAIKVGMKAYVRGTGYSAEGFIIKIDDDGGNK